MNVADGKLGEGFFDIIVATLVGAAFYRFVNEWWLKKGEVVQSPLPQPSSEQQKDLESK
jgi:hypothetical protein